MEAKKNNKLEISKSGTKILTKSQKLFNKLTAQISQIEKKTEQSYKKNEALFVLFTEKITPLMAKEQELNVKIAEALSNSAKLLNFSKQQLKRLGSVICYLLEISFETIAPDEQVTSLFNKWSAFSYEEIVEEEKRKLSMFFKDMTGVDVDFTKFETPEDFASASQEIQEKIKQKEEQNQSKKKNRKKTPQQIKAEMVKELEEKQQVKTLRSIYISLVKILHPDTETDEEQKLIKEEIMKKVTVAYNEKDITALLKLEIEWISQDTSNIEQLSEEKLKVFNDMLKDQVRELEAKLRMQNENPRYSILQDLIYFPENSAIKKIQYMEKDYLKDISILEEIDTVLGNNLSKKEVLNVIKQLEVEDEEEDEFENLFSQIFR